MIQSPLNYTGGKFRLLPQILPHFPKKIDTFVDLFCGGCNVGINVECNKVIYNDLCRELMLIYGVFQNVEKDEVFRLIYEIIDKYKLSLVSKYGYEYYNCDSSKGLGEYNKENFLRLRDDFNNNTKQEHYYYIMLYVIIIYAFNNQIRFNSDGDFNLPVGKRDFNKNMQKKLSDFIDIIKKQNCVFSSKDFREIDLTFLNGEDFVYADPPYLITCASYNEKGGWSEKDEKDLLSFLDNLNEKGIKFALSNVLRSKGKENSILINWLKENEEKYRTIFLNYSYSNSNYHTKDKKSSAEEVLIINYGNRAEGE